MIVRRGGLSAASLRALLTLVLPALLACQPPDPKTPPAPRYEVHAIQSREGPMLVRFDSATGAIDGSPLAGGRVWAPIGGAAPLGPGEEALPGRFGFDFANAPSIPLTLYRFDRDTGEVWRLAYPRDREWVAYREEVESVRETARPPAAHPRPAPPANADRPAPPRPEPAPAAEAPKPHAGRIPGPLAPGEERPFVKAIESPQLPTVMRVWAIEQLASLGEERALEPLLGALGDSDPEVVRVSIQQLANFKDPKVVPAIRALVDDEREPVRKVAVAALAKLE